MRDQIQKMFNLSAAGHVSAVDRIEMHLILCPCIRVLRHHLCQIRTVKIRITGLPGQYGGGERTTLYAQSRQYRDCRGQGAFAETG